MSLSTASVAHLSAAAFLNRAVYGGRNALPDAFLSDYDPARDPAPAGDRAALNVYEAYDTYLAGFGFTALDAIELGFDPAETGASDLTDGLDRSFTYSGGLFRNTFQRFEDGTEAPFTDAGAVALAVTAPGQDGDILHLVFRGTDADLGSDGEAGTAAGQARYYRQLQPLIDQAYEFAADPANGIAEVVVSGQSLGGQQSDLFALYDGARFDALGGVALSVVSLASAGIEPGVFALMPDYDSSLVRVGTSGIELVTPDYLLQYAHAEDIVYFLERYDAARHAETDPEQAPITAFATGLLRDHLHFEGNLIEVEAPQVPQYALSPFFETNFLAQHYPSFYGLTGQALAAAVETAASVAPGFDLGRFDAFVALYGRDPDLTATSGGNNVNAFDLDANDRVDFAGRGAQDLFVLALSGDDRVATGSGDNLIDGGAGADWLRGRAGDDILLGGEGRDCLAGGRGDDIVSGGAGPDVFRFLRETATDIVADFEPGTDRIDFSDHMGFRNYGQLRRAAEADDDGLTLASGGHEIVLAGLDMGDLSRHDFLF